MSDLLLYFDGRCTGNGTPFARAGYGWVLIGSDGEELASGKGMAGEGEGVTVVVAEYAALLAALRGLLDLREELGDVGMVEVRGDSQTVIRQVTGVTGCWAEHLKPLHQEVLVLAERLQAAGFPSLVLRWIPSKENKRANELARQAFDEARKHESGGYSGAGDSITMPLPFAGI